MQYNYSRKGVIQLVVILLIFLFICFEKINNNKSEPDKFSGKNSNMMDKKNKYFLKTLFQIFRVYKFVNM